MPAIDRILAKNSRDARPLVVFVDPHPISTASLHEAFVAKTYSVDEVIQKEDLATRTLAVVENTTASARWCA